MQFSFSYNKAKVLQGLRYHFITRQEIRVLVILVNLFAILSAVLFYTKKIRPEPFLLSTVLWLFLMVSFWYLLPYTIYRRSTTFKESFTIFFFERQIRLKNTRGFVDWNWSDFSHFFESPHFFHLYFSSRAFFLLPKEGLNEETIRSIRTLFNVHIKKK